MNKLIHADNMTVLPDIETGSVNLIYTDPPFNTGKPRVSPRGKGSFGDMFDNFISFLRPRMEEAFRILAGDGSLFLHVDYREVHYCKIMLDEIFGRKCFMNEIIWAYDYGGRSKRKWSAKHDNILWYVKDPKNYTFNFEEMDRIPYMAPGLVGKEKAARGKTPTDVWWHTIVATNSAERTGYPTQKPLGVLERIIKIHSKRGDLVLDLFAGSGTTGVAAARNGRSFLLIDNNMEALDVIAGRLAFTEFEEKEGRNGTSI